MILFALFEQSNSYPSTISDNLLFTSHLYYMQDYFEYAYFFETDPDTHILSEPKCYIKSDDYHSLILSVSLQS